MDSRGSDDNAFTEVAAKVGESLFSILKRLGLNDNQATKALQFFANSPTSSSALLGFKKNAQGELVVAGEKGDSGVIKLSTSALEAITGNAGFASQSTKPSYLPANAIALSDLTPAERKAVEAGQSSLVPAYNDVGKATTSQIYYVSKDLDVDKDGDYDKNDRDTIARRDAAVRAAANEAATAAQWAQADNIVGAPSDNSSRPPTRTFSNSDGDTYEVSDINRDGTIDITDLASVMPDAAAEVAAATNPQPAAPPPKVITSADAPTILNPAFPNQSKYSDAEWETAKQKARATITDGYHSAPVFEPDGTYSGLYITKDGHTYTPTDVDGNGLNDQQENWYKQNGLAFRGDPPTPDDTPPPATPAPLTSADAPTVLNPPLPNQAKYSDAQWEAAKLKAMATITDGYHSAPLVEPDGTTYSGVYITKDGNTYTPTDVDGNGLNDQQENWYKQNGLAFRGDPPGLPGSSEGGSGDGSDPDPGGGTGGGTTPPNGDLNDQPAPNPPPTGWDAFTFAEWERVMLDTMNSIPQGQHSAALPKPDGTYSDVYITKDGNTFTPTDADNNGRVDQQEAWYRERGLPFPGDPAPGGGTDPDPDPGGGTTPPNGDLNDQPAPNPAPADWDKHTFADWEETMLAAMDSIGKNGNNLHSVALPTPSGTFSGVFITKDGVTYTPTNNEGLSDQDGLNDQQRAWYRQEGIPLPGSDPDPDPGGGTTPPNGDLNSLPEPNPTPSGWNSFTGEQWQSVMQDTMNAIPAGKHSAALPKPDGSYSDVFITKDGNLFTPTDANGDGINDQQHAFMTEQAMQTIGENQHGAAVGLHDGGYSGVYVDRSGNTYTPVNADGDAFEDHDEEHMIRKAMATIPANGHSAPVANPDGTYSGLYVDRNGNTFTPTDNDSNGILDQDEAAYIERAIAQIGPYQNGAPLTDTNGNWTGQYVDRQGNKYYPANNSGGPFDDRDEAYAMQASIAQIPANAHGGPLYNPDGTQTGQWVDRNGVTYTPTWDQGPFNNLGLGQTTSGHIEDHAEAKYIQDAHGRIPAGSWGTEVTSPDGQWLGYYVGRDGTPYIPTDVNGVPGEDHQNAYDAAQSGTPF